MLYDVISRPFDEDAMFLDLILVRRKAQILTYRGNTLDSVALRIEAHLGGFLNCKCQTVAYSVYIMRISILQTGYSSISY